ncbi:hypothetical protein [Enterobacter hormaechei]|uniref:hypothetical protein n=1 Tax=Enterobacter hormaechei TaxID=158836 RepID=UPI003526A136
MSNIDKHLQKELYAKVERQAHSLRGSPREYQALTGLCPVNVIEMHAQKIQALLDELEAVQKTSAARLGAIDTTHKMFQRERARAEAAEKRIADYQELISGLVGVSSSILREVERINNAAAAGKGE